MKSNLLIFLISTSALLGLSCTSTSKTDAVAVSETSAASAKRAPAKEYAPLSSTGRGCDGQPGLSISDRLGNIDRAIADAKEELTRGVDLDNDRDARARIGSFAAGAVDDEVSFIEVDRQCWVSFYEARNYLKAGDLSSAEQSSKEWNACIGAFFPNRLSLVQPYFSCFKK